MHCKHKCFHVYAFLQIWQNEQFHYDLNLPFDFVLLSKL